MRPLVRILFLGLLILITGCSSLEPFLFTPTPAPSKQATSTPELVPSTTPATVETPQPTLEGAHVLRIWLPPQFDPEAGTAASNLLKQRLNLFQAQHPGLEIEVRVKAVNGDASLLDSLSMTSMAAPRALPDLIALSHSDLVTAAQKGLLLPLNENSSVLQDSNWYDYAREFAAFEDTTYGFPFAGDALLLLYRPELVWIKSWDDILLSKGSLVFAGADPQALVGLSLYASAGGKLTDDQGNPTLDEEVLNRVLELFANGRAANLFINADTNLVTDEQVLQEYRARRANLAIIHTSNPLDSADGLTQSLMGLDETPVSFATGWAWALSDAGQNAENQQLAIELAEYLVEPGFLNSWTNEMGYLPVHPSAVGTDDTVTKAVVDSVQPIPSDDLLSVLSPLMQDAIARVLNGEQHDTVAKDVVEKLK
jgi:ABC-type glycerol-3-phosphate transport system substrate-binding protein